MSGIERVEQREHAMRGGVLERVLIFQANVNVPSFAARYVTREMCAWDERSTYDIERHAASWTIVPAGKPEWRKYFSEALPERTSSWRSARPPHQSWVVRGDLALRVPAIFRHCRRANDRE